MLKLNCNIEIGQGAKVWQFGFVNNCTIVEDVDTLTDTCAIVMPKKIVWQGLPVGSGKEAPIKRGDFVKVQLGYDNTFETRFVGFVRSVDNKTPVTIFCEDMMYKLKLKSLQKKSFKAATLDILVSFLLEGTNIKYELIDKNLKLGYYRITKATAAEQLNEFKEYGLKSFFRIVDNEAKLFVGLGNPYSNVKTEKFEYAKNIVSENFEFKNKEDLKFKVKAISNNTKNELLKVELGDKDGELIEIKIFGLTKAELTKFAQHALDNAKYEGLRGNFTTFGEPFVCKADKVKLKTADNKTGTFIIKKNTITFGTNGYSQNIELGAIVSK